MSADILNSFRSSVCSNIRLEELGLDEYLVHTGFTFSDGDEFHIVLRTADSKWSLTDEGHTIMWLSYEDFNMTPVRSDIFERILRTNSIQSKEGALTVHFEPERSGPALYSLTQAIMQVSDLRFMSKARVANTFIDDMKGAFRTSVMNSRCRFDHMVETSVGETLIPDVYIEEENPILIFGITNTENCRDVIISILTLERSKPKYRYIAIVENLESLVSKDRQRLTRVADKTIEGISDVTQSVERLISISEAKT